MARSDVDLGRTGNDQVLCGFSGRNLAPAFLGRRFLDEHSLGLKESSLDQEDSELLSSRPFLLFGGVIMRYSRNVKRLERNLRCSNRAESRPGLLVRNIPADRL